MAGSPEGTRARFAVQPVESPRSTEDIVLRVNGVEGIYSKGKCIKITHKGDVKKEDKNIYRIESFWFNSQTGALKGIHCSYWEKGAKKWSDHHSSLDFEYIVTLREVPSPELTQG